MCVVFFLYYLLFHGRETSGMPHFLLTAATVRPEFRLCRSYNVRQDSRRSQCFRFFFFLSLFAFVVAEWDGYEFAPCPFLSEFRKMFCSTFRNFSETFFKVHIIFKAKFHVPKTRIENVRQNIIIIIIRNFHLTYAHGSIIAISSERFQN